MNGVRCWKIGVMMLRYEEYKDSGVEWVGKIPKHWDVTRNKDIFEERGQISKTGNETLLNLKQACNFSDII